jgi:Mg2+-importing ATPase
VLGHDIDALDDEALGELATSTTLFARVDPEQKARVVRALRRTGHAVGFVGDGVNDTAALRTADIGITVAGALPAARTSADATLTHDGLDALPAALTRARHALANIATYLRVTLSANVGNAMSMLAAGLTLPFLPMLPLQVLLQNLCFDAAQLSLAFDRPDPENARTANPLDVRDLTRFVVRLAPINTLADLAAFVLLRHLTGGHTDPAAQALFHTGWFVENLLTQTLAIHLLRGRRPGMRRHRPARPVLLATGALAALALAAPYAPLAATLGLTPLPLGYYPPLVAILTGYAILTRTANIRHHERRAS